jgi:hypothetical protein
MQYMLQVMKGAFTPATLCLSGLMEITIIEPLKHEE